MLQLDAQLHTHPNHGWFLVCLPQCHSLRDRRDLWCYLKFSVLSNFWAAAVPQVSCTKPCCVWTCEFSQKTKKSVFSDSLDYILLPVDFQQLCLNLGMTDKKKKLAVTVNWQEKNERVQALSFLMEVSLLKPSLLEHKSNPIFGNQDFVGGPDFIQMSECKAAVYFLGMVYTWTTSISPASSFCLNWPSSVSYQLFLHCSCGICTLSQRANINAVSCWV